MKNKIKVLSAAILSACLLTGSLCGCNCNAPVAGTTAPETAAALTETTVEDTRTEPAEMETQTETTVPETAAPESETETTASARTTAVESTPPIAGTTKQPPESTTAPATSAAETRHEEPENPSVTRKSLLRQLRESLESGTRKKDPAFFDDAVFIGDSVTMGLKNYVTAVRNKGNACLGAAQFLCCGSMGYTNTLGKVGSGSMHPTYKGSKVTVEDGVSLCGAGKAFIMLGMNDFSGYGEKTWKNSVITLLDRIETKNPGVDIYIESVTPILSGMEHGSFTNAGVCAFNAYLQAVCSDRGYTYVDIYSCLADESGCLKKSYCGDANAMGIHMSNEGAAVWVQYLQQTFCGDT